MTDTVNVLLHLRELEATWRRQEFKYTKQQQEEYDLLIATRRERVAYFYENDLGCDSKNLKYFEKYFRYF